MKEKGKLWIYWRYQIWIEVLLAVYARARSFWNLTVSGTINLYLHHPQMLHRCGCNACGGRRSFWQWRRCREISDFINGTQPFGSHLRHAHTMENKYKDALKVERYNEDHLKQETLHTENCEIHVCAYWSGTLSHTTLGSKYMLESVGLCTRMQFQAVGVAGKLSIRLYRDNLTLYHIT